MRGDDDDDATSTQLFFTPSPLSRLLHTAAFTILKLQAFVDRKRAKEANFQLHFVF